MRSFIWNRCLINGLTTLIIGYVVLVPYSLALTLLTVPNGHSWPILRGITPQMHLNRAWIYEPSVVEKLLALVTIPMCLVPGIGIVACWFILWRLRWCTGWVYKTAEITSFLAYLVSVIALAQYL